MDEKYKRICSGPTGEEFKATYLPKAGLYFPEIRFDNAVMCSGDKTPNDELVRSCAEWHYVSRLPVIRPEVLVLMGASACRILDQPIKLDTHHGIPIENASVLGGLWRGKVWPSYHPSLGMHDTSKMTHLLTDFENLGKWLRGDWQPVKPSILGPKDYALVETVSELNSYLVSPQARVQMGNDTESHGKEQWSIQISHTANTGRLIRANNEPVMRAFRSFVREVPEVEWVFHHSIHDLDESERMGVEYRKFRDTMQEAYQACFLPQGLKPLAFRLLGVQMRSWEDVVLPASQDALETWLTDAWLIAQDELFEIEETTGTRGWCRICGHGAHKKKACTKCRCAVIGDTTLVKQDRKRGAVEAMVEHLLKHGRGEDYDPWGKLEEMWVGGLRGKVPEPWEREFVEERLGPPPILGIGNAKFEDALEYAIGDADRTLQVAGALELVRQSDRWNIHESDRDQ